MTALFNYTLSLADDALVLGHRLSEWCGHAPTLEEDLALANIGLDLIGQARALYALAAEIEFSGRDEDDLSFQRSEGEYKNLLICELPNGDFAFTIARLFIYSAFMHPYWKALMASSETRLAALAERSEKEVAYHLKHAGDWMIRLGDGTVESHRRAQKALDDLCIWAGELFEMSEAEQQFVKDGTIPDRKSLLDSFNATVEKVLDEATLQKPQGTYMQTGGRLGRHTEHLGYMLSEMQVLARRDPEAVW